MKYESFSAARTEEIAAGIAASAEKGAIYCLSGELGAGKTVFSKGFAKGLGVVEYVTSPTFTIVNVYESGRMPLYHFDAYRLSGSDDMYETGCEDYFYGEGVCLVEWAELVKDIIPDYAVWIDIKKDFLKGEDYRVVTIAEGGGV